MSGELAEIGQGVMVRSAEDILSQRAVILNVMKKCMKEGQDYGIIPGCKLPSLYKPGAEKILSVFRIAVDEPKVEDLSTEDERRYRATVRLISCTGVFLGATVGECSSNEDKYKWKKAVCEEEWNETPENMRREKWKPGKNGTVYKVKQIRTQIADVSNTVLSMAIKRAMVADTRQVTGTSDLFTNEIESLEDLINNGGDPEEKHTEPKPTTEAPKTVDEVKKAAEATPALAPENKIPLIEGKVTKIEPHKYKSGKFKTDYSLDCGDNGLVVIAEWKEPNKAIVVGGTVKAVNVTMGKYKDETTYTAESIGVDVQM